MTLSVDNISYSYNKGLPTECEALRGVSFRAESGILSVIGHTGSGKSTLAQHLNALIIPQSGSVTVDGSDTSGSPAEVRAVRKKVGLVFQYPEQQIFAESVEEEISFAPKNWGFDEEGVKKNVAEALAAVSLSAEFLPLQPHNLSGGQKRKIAIASVIAAKPSYLVLDEPTAGLDPKGRDRILGQIKRYHKERGNTVLLVSHSMEDIARYARKVLVLNRSGVAMYDDVANVFSHAEEITKMGLSVPQVTRIFMGLREQGFPVSVSVYTMDYAREELLSLLGKGAGNHA